ncbi:hypothetical protein OAZ15_05015 [Pelagibacteraceae bacterium]|nr:hypothetical protein [Pelagibacteraceae bacterium]
MSSDCPTLYNHFFLDDKSIHPENLLTIDDLERHIKNFSSAFNYSFSIGPSVQRLKAIYKKLESLDNKIINQNVLDEIYKIIFNYRGCESEIIISEKKQQIPSDLKKILNENKEIQSILLNNKSINSLFDNNFNEEKRKDLYKLIPLHIKSIETFLDYNLIDKISTTIHEGTNIKEFFSKNLQDLINISTNISILDKHCLHSLEKTPKNAVHGLNFLFDLISNSNIQLVEIICLPSDNKTKMNPDQIIDLFSSKVLNLDNKKLIQKNTFSNSMNLENFNFDFSDATSATKRVEITMLKPTEFKKRDRYILFDDHSAIDIHDLNSWTTTHEKLRQDTNCYINNAIDSYKIFESYKTKAFIKKKTLEF